MAVVNRSFLQQDANTCSILGTLSFLLQKYQLSSIRVATVIWSSLEACSMVFSSMFPVSVGWLMKCDPVQSCCCMPFGCRVPDLLPQSTGKHVNINSSCAWKSLSCEELWRKDFYRHRQNILMFITHTGNHSFYLTKILAFNWSVSFYFALFGDGKQLVTI